MRNVFKVTIEKKTAVENDNYPCYKMADNGTIVLFNKPRGGTVIRKGSNWGGIPEVGEYISNWCESQFKPIHDTLRIEML